MTGPLSAGKELARAAAQLIGVPFRLHGRDPATGLDCIGLVHASLIVIDRKPRSPEGYRLRNGDISAWLCFAELSGFGKVSGPFQEGDLILSTPGPGQHHLTVFEGRQTFIHAHAGLGRVVRQTISLSDPVLSHWRLF
jgi:cell wall-associated NlpC family hydrolase